MMLSALGETNIRETSSVKRTKEVEANRIYKTTDASAGEK
jgi:hypothetical protein